MNDNQVAVTGDSATSDEKNSYPFHYPLRWKTRGGLPVLVLSDQPCNDYILCAINYGFDNPTGRIPRDELEE